MNNFKDNFSKQAQIYSQYRPKYPIEMMEFLSALTPAHELAWDCGTGNGQAAQLLISKFKKVIATDPSSEQIRYSAQLPGIDYRVETAERTTVESNSADIITVANALHWFKLDSFYAVADRILKQNGILAVWCYGTPKFDPKVDAVVKELHDNVLGSYWLKENKIVEEEYAAIHLPFKKINCPVFYSKREMSFNDAVNYLKTWSAARRYTDVNSNCPVDAIADSLYKAWDSKPNHTAEWKITLLASRKEKI